MPELKQIRAAHASANPKDDNPAWKFCHRDLGYVISLYDAEVYETDALKTRLVDASKRIKELEDAKRVWQESAERTLDNATRRYRVAVELFAAYDPDCTCGMCVPCISRKTLKHE